MDHPRVIESPTLELQTREHVNQFVESLRVVLLERLGEGVYFRCDMASEIILGSLHRGLGVTFRLDAFSLNDKQEIEVNG